MRRDGRAEVRLSVIVPAYHEADTIASTIERIRAELAAVVEDGGLEVVVVDDGSTDGTAEAAAGADQVIQLGSNQGKGAAVRAGMFAATGRTLVFTDADLSYAPSQIVRLLAAVEEGWDVVVGNRYHPASTTVVDAGLVRRVGGRFINLATRAVLDGDHPDTQCGLKAFRADVGRLVFGRSRIDGFAFDVEIIHLVERYRLRLLEVEVQVENSDRSTVHVARDAVRLLVDLVRIAANARRGRYDLDHEDRSLAAAGDPSPRE